MDRVDIYRYGILVLGIIVISIASCYFAIWLAKKLNIIDYPNTELHKLHTHPTPLAGGIAIFLTLISFLIIRNDWISEKWIGVMIGAGIIFVFGLWDDAYRFTYSTKLLGQIIGGLLLIASGANILIIHSPNFFWVNWIITLIWVVGLVNAFNFIDSMDDIVLGLAFIAFTFLTLSFAWQGNYFLFEMSLVLCSTSLVLFFFNHTPAKMFLGDSGSQVLGYFAAVLCIFLLKNKDYYDSAIVPAILLMAIPIFNITMVVFSRIRRGYPVYRARMDQVYHRLVKYGLKEITAVRVIHLSALIVSILAAFTFLTKPLVAWTILAIIIIIGIILIYLFDSKKSWN